MSLHSHDWPNQGATHTRPHTRTLLGATALLQRGRQPVQALVKTIAVGRARRLDVPRAVQAVQLQRVRHLRRGHGLGQILLVREHQHDRVTQLVLIQQVRGRPSVVLMLGRLTSRNMEQREQ